MSMFDYDHDHDYDHEYEQEREQELQGKLTASQVSFMLANDFIKTDLHWRGLLGSSHYVSCSR